MNNLQPDSQPPTAAQLRHTTSLPSARFATERTLELAIFYAGQALLAAPDEATQRICLVALTDLVKQRSPEQVRQMERAKRLA